VLRDALSFLINTMAKIPPILVCSNAQAVLMEIMTLASVLISAFFKILNIHGRIEITIFASLFVHIATTPIIRQEDAN